VLLSRVLWSVCALWTVGVLLEYLWATAHAGTVLDQAAAAARAGLWVVAGYVLCRAAHGLAGEPPP
jgi:hypothetical protein